MKRKHMGKKKKIIITVCSLAVIAVVAGGVRFFVLKPNRVIAMESADAISTQVTTGDISTTVVGTGTLQNDTAVSVSLPEGIDVSEVLVESGDSVTAGDVLATLDTASIQKKLIEVQEELESLDEEINEVKDDKESAYVTTYVSGRIKKIYAEKSDVVTDVMKEHGALALLSLDGLMAVEVKNKTDLSVGDTVTVTLSDDDTVEGTVESIEDENCIITMTDNGPELDEKVTVTDEEGTKVGTGKLYIHRQLEITGTAGTISKIPVSENEKVSAESTIFKLKDVPDSTEYQQLLAERTSLAETLKQLTNLMTEGAIKAEFDGIIESVNVSENSTTEKSSGTTTTGTTSGMSMASADIETADSVITFASTADTEKSTESKITSITDEEVEKILQTLAVSAPVTDAVPVSEIKETDAYTGTITWDPTDTKYAESSVYTAVIELTAKEGYQFVLSTEASLIFPNASQLLWEVEDQCEQNTLKLTVTFPETAAKETETSQTETNQQETAQTESAKTDETQPQTQPQSESETKDTGKTQQTETDSSAKDDTTGTTGTISTGGSVSGGSSSSTSSGGSTSTAAATTTTSSGTSEESVDADSVTAFTISPAENMILSVSVDELDILSIEEGQTAVLTLDAIDGETFEGSITKINRSASSSSGGVSKYTVEITIPKNESMLSGMNASATITVESKEDILMLPADAIQERGNRSFVYTEQDEEGNLSGETEVETGLSNGTQVEIVSGLTEEQTVYYNRAASTDGESSEENSRMGMMGGGGGFSGGEMPSGERPSGMQGGGGVPGGSQ